MSKQTSKNKPMEEHWHTAFKSRRVVNDASADKVYWLNSATDIHKVADRIVPKEELDKVLAEINTLNITIAVKTVDPLAEFKEITLEPGCTYLAFNITGFYRSKESSFYHDAMHQFAALNDYIIERLKPKQ